MAAEGLVPENFSMRGLSARAVFFKAEKKAYRNYLQAFDFTGASLET